MKTFIAPETCQAVRPIHRWALGFLVLLAMLTPARRGHAQAMSQDATPSDNIQPHEMITDRFKRREIEQGTWIGAFQISPSINFGMGYDDNVYGGQGLNKKDDLFGTYGGNANVKYVHGSMSANLSADIQDRRYVNLTHDDYWVGGGRLTVTDQVTHDFAVLGSGEARRQIVPRGSPQDVNGTRPTVYELYSIEPGVRFGDPQLNSASIYFGVNQTRYEPVTTTNGEISQTQQDRREIYGDVHLQHTFFRQQAAFLDVRPDSRSYSVDPDSLGFRRDSTGVRADIGMTFDFNDLYKLTASAGYQNRSYDDPRFGTVGEPDINLDLVWTPSNLTSVDLKYVHEYTEYVIEVQGTSTSPGYVHDMEAIQVDHEFQRNLIGSVNFSYDRQQYVKSSLHYNVLSPGLDVQYLFTNGMSVKFDYAFAHQTRTDTGTSSDRNVFLVSFVKRF